MEFAQFDEFFIAMTREQALECSQPGDCTRLVQDALAGESGEQFIGISPQAIRDALAEYGAWSDEELQDVYANRERIFWIAAGDIREEINN